MKAQELFDVLYGELCDAKDAFYARRAPYPGPSEGYAELLADVQAWRGGATVPKGTTIRIVFVSNMGDFGCTTDLARTELGYDWRMPPDDALLANCRRTAVT